MKPADKVKRLIRGASFRANPEADKALWTAILKEQNRRRPPEQTQNRRGLAKLGVHVWTTKAGAAVMLTAGIVIGSMVPRAQTDAKPTEPSRGETRTPENLEPDIFSMRQMAAAQDVKGLATILSEGQFESRLVAANFLARLAPLPALETVSMHAVGELRADRQGGNLRLYSTEGADWLELADSTITVHTGSTQQRATLVRLTRAGAGIEPQRNSPQMNLGHLRKERADIEKQLAGGNGNPGDVSQLRNRVEMYSRVLDLIDGAVYVSPAQGGLHLQDRVHHEETALFPSDNGVRAEWHGVTVDANRITLQRGLAPIRTDGPSAPPANWRDQFDRVYSLADGEALRWIRPPFIPERQYFIQEMSENSTSSPGHRTQWAFLSLRWDGRLRPLICGKHERMLGAILRDLGTELGLRQYETSGPAELVQLQLGGDWIVRTGTSLEQRFGALERILERELERRIRFVPKKVEREVIVVRGRYERRPLEGCEDTEAIYLFTETDPCEAKILGPTTQVSVAEMLHRVGERFNRPIVLEAQGLDEATIRYQQCLSYIMPTRSAPKPDDPFPTHGGENLDSVLANLTRQTSLEFSRQTRPFDMWFVTEVGKPNDTNVNEETSSQK